VTPEQIRLEALRLAIPDTKILTPDTKLILARAREYEEYIVGDTQQPARVKRSTGKDSAELPTGAKP
jgi:hypothetical protein